MERLIYKVGDPKRQAACQRVRSPLAMGVTTSREEEERDECRARPSASLAELDNRPETPPLLADGRAQSDGNLDGIVPTPFTWGYGGQSVYVTGAWDDWRVKVALSPVSGREFSAVLALPLGYHQYKFIVDGNWKYVCFAIRLRFGDGRTTARH